MSVRLSKAIRVADSAHAILLRVQAFDDSALTKEENWSLPRHNGIEPMLLALSMELALKAWFMFDFDVAEVKKTHNLRKLFKALKPESQKRLAAGFQNTIAPDHFPKFVYGDLGIEDFLEHHADAFVDWRYLHEATQLHFNTGAFIATLEMVLREFRKRYRETRITPTFGRRLAQ